MQLPRIVKELTTPLVGRVPVSIAGGPNRGMKWSLASSGNGFRRGTREPERMAFLAALIHPGDVVWDVGAHYGYVALLAARRAGETAATMQIAIETAATTAKFTGSTRTGSVVTRNTSFGSSMNW